MHYNIFIILHKKVKVQDTNVNSVSTSNQSKQSNKDDQLNDTIVYNKNENINKIVGAAIDTQDNYEPIRNDQESCKNDIVIDNDSHIQVNELEKSLNQHMKFNKNSSTLSSDVLTQKGLNLIVDLNFKNNHNNASTKEDVSEEAVVYMKNCHTPSLPPRRGRHPEIIADSEENP